LGDAEFALDARFGRDNKGFVLASLGVEFYLEYVGLRGTAGVAVAASDAEVSVDNGILMGDFVGQMRFLYCKGDPPGRPYK
jgi:hypothetical protein